ncbi:MAG: selenium cofactor biosynthesis protein YqeC [Anaerolineae bacterium]|jgi:molybdenum cofactor cytidylyltransferase|nr:selenium cofactor biosynthesis protein YqeC [Anaerolineae bacterium]
MKLSEAFEIVRGDVVSLIGAGGKTSLMLALGYELAEAGWRVLGTTTVSTNAQQLEVMPHPLRADTSVTEISEALNEHRFVFLYQGLQRGRFSGVTQSYISQLLDTVDSDLLLVEADTANGLPFKAPFVDEPMIPHETSLVIPVAALNVIGKPLDEQHVYNMEAMIERYGFPQGVPIKSPWIAQVMRDEVLGLKGVPELRRVIGFLNGIPSKGWRGRARMISRLMLRSPRFSGVVLGSVRGAQQVYEVQRPIGAVVLAAGLSTRMGQPKMLLPWTDERTIIEHIVYQLIRARIDQITVVTGHYSREIKALLKPLEVQVIYNKNYKTGEMLSSLKVGLGAFGGNIAAALVVLGDQPRLQPKTLYHLLHHYSESTHDLIIPSFQMRRGHPVLIGRRYWGEIQNLASDRSLRDFLNTHSERIHYVNIDNDSILRDVDTPQDYQDERWRAGL